MEQNEFQIERKRLADQVADQLIRMIADGTLTPGDRLPSEPELMKRFNVGRSSIREAIGALSLAGLLSVKPGQGTHVTPFSPDQRLKTTGLLTIGPDRVTELVEARIELESVIIKLAAQRATESDLALIKTAHESVKESLDKGIAPIDPDMEFHLAIARVSQNTVLMKFLSDMRQPTRHWMEQKAKFNWGYEKVYEQHQKIVDAIERRDVTEAEQALRNHLESTGEKLITALIGSSAS
ncbi:MAG: FadR family transcriptional regulator [Desulfobulbaceae bacterium]|nr:MAG: FadR family transcriptional regulator [Desulfobulbaceae bacterium]